jgi:hypothetical protein
VTNLLLADEGKIQGSRYANYDSFIATVSEQYELPYVTEADLGLPIDDHWFWNQDHMRPRYAEQVWKKAIDVCFGAT